MSHQKSTIEVFSGDQLVDMAQQPGFDTNMFTPLFDEVTELYLDCVFSPKTSCTSCSYSKAKTKKHFVMSLGQEVIGVARAEISGATKNSFRVSNLRMAGEYTDSPQQAELKAAVANWALEHGFSLT
jgi:hypothetical protein